ncbi:hypothetical protein RJ640_030664 [Escallonia rubra]|uniref:EamA domain-containing protein n=1 Tax=Escallonia rubra TaxID=112253 RepID=A0AA88RLD2_9ASTE|nr:hypothetical protein RJ640_030664 [Escallonia rubra]
MSKESSSSLQMFNRAKPYILMVFVQKCQTKNDYHHFLQDIFARVIGVRISNSTYCLPNYVTQVLLRSAKPNICTCRPAIDQNLYYAGLKYTTATFATAMTNIVPAITFCMAWILRLEKVDIKELRSQGKIVGTLVTLGGAMIMTLVKGPTIALPWTKPKEISNHHSTSNPQDPIKGALMIAAACFCWAIFIILQGITLKSYPAELSLAALICMMGSLQGTVLTLLAERGNAAIWSIRWDIKLLAAVYSGIICSGIGYYFSGLVLKEKGPVFVTAFNPLSLVIVAIMASFILAEQMDLGRVLGAIVIAVGLYLVIWGKAKDQISSDSGKDPQVARVDHPQTTTTNDGGHTLTHDDDNHLAITLLNQAKPYLAVILLQFGYAGMGVIVKSALNKGMNHYTFAVYRNASAAALFAPFAIFFEREARPRMTVSTFFKILLLSLLELEQVDVRRLHSQGKILGTLVTVGGAMVMTLVKGPKIGLPWTKNSSHAQSTAAANQQDSIKGSLMMAAGLFCWASFVILQAITLKKYPAALSLTALICMMGAMEGTVLTLLVERGNTAIWSIHWDTKLLAALYGGIICSGVSYYVTGLMMKAKGPVFVTAFNPLGMVIVAIMSSFIFAEQMDLGRVLGAIIIVLGLYLVIWGKRKDQDLSNCAGDQTASADPQMTVMNYGKQTSAKDDYPFAGVSSIKITGAV